MSVTVPYHEDMSLGRMVDVKNLTFGDELSNYRPIQIEKVCQLKNHVSYIGCITDICTILETPLEYILKVKAGIIKNEVVSSCLDAIGDRICTFIFRTSLIQELQDLPSAEEEILKSFLEDDYTVFQFEKVTDKSQVKTESTADGFKGTHVVKSLEVGNEMVIIMSVSTEDQNESKKYIQEIFKIMKAPDCSLDTHKIEAFYKFAKKKSAKLMKKGLLSFKYISFDNLTKYPASFDGMIKTFYTFMKENERWMEMYKEEKCEVVPCQMKCRPGEIVEMASTVQIVIDTAKKIYHCQDRFKAACKYLSPETTEDMSKDIIQELHTKDIDDSIKHNSRNFFYLKASLFIQQHAGNQSDCMSLGSIHIGIADKQIKTHLFEKMYDSLMKNSDDLNNVVTYLASEPEFLKIHHEEAKMIMDTIKDDIRSVYEFVARLDFISVPVNDTINEVIRRDHSTTVHEFIKRLKSKLPPGIDLDLLLLGKTGHGKSATGNSILNKLIFKSSDDSTSVTTQVHEGYAIVDGRTIKVVDTPGVCDTGVINKTDQTESAVDAQIDTRVETHDVCVKMETSTIDHIDLAVDVLTMAVVDTHVMGDTSVNNKGQLIDIPVDTKSDKPVESHSLCDTNMINTRNHVSLAIKSISDAIAYCSEGFHALIIVLQYGIRMTNEEQMAIKLLKRVLGSDIIKKYCICIFTHGDNFEQKIFSDWCKAQKGFMKEFLEECNYRCVLFDNKTTDPEKKKSQLIKLVYLIDRLQSGSQRYTNELFEIAQSERNRLIEEEKLPEIKEEIMREVQIVYSKLQEINTKETTDQNKIELNILKKSVDDLKNKTSGDINLKTLFEIAENLSLTIEKAFEELEKQESAKITTNESNDQVNPKSELEDKLRGNKSEETCVNLDNSCNDTGLDFVLYEKQIEEKFIFINEKSKDINDKTSKKIQDEIEKKGINCFPGDSSVFLQNGKSVTLNELEIGDQVLTRNADGYLAFDTVYMFGHQDFNKYTEFLTIETIYSKMSITAGHYIYCERNGQEICLSAENINIRDKVYVFMDDHFVSCSVIRITLNRKQGLFAPFTTNGNIVINGILASCYINVLHPVLCHNLLWPVRQLYKIFPQALTYINGSSSTDPVPKWALFFVKWISIVKTKLHFLTY